MRCGGMMKKQDVTEAVVDLTSDFVEAREWGELQHLSEREFWSAAAPVVRRAASDALMNMRQLESMVDSPIEALFLIAFWRVCGCRNMHVTDNNGSAVWSGEPSDPFDVEIQTQAKVGPYRADVLVTVKHSTNKEERYRPIAVELDGHDFHERTKAQAAHDKKRDRFFVAQGIVLLRFTGSEVTRDAVACANEVCLLMGQRVAA